MLDISKIKKEDIPRYLKGQNKFLVWNTFDKTRGLVGAEGCKYKTIVGRDGSFAPEPHPNLITFWIYDHKEKRLYTPETLKCKWSLAEGRLPVSIVKWKVKDIEVETTVFASRNISGGHLINFARISVTNKGLNIKDLSLYVVIRNCGLFRRRDKKGVREIGYNDNDNFIRVNGRTGLYVRKKPAAFGCCALKDGDIWKFAKDGSLPAATKVTDKLGYASGAVVYKMKLKPRKKEIWDFAVPSEEKEKNNLASTLDFTPSLKNVKQYWKKRVPFSLYLPDEEYANTFYSSIYYILMLMSGRQLWSGPYAPGYDQFTLHDAVEMADALDKAGLREVVKGALDRFNYKNTDPYLDALGGSLYALYEHYRMTKDKKWLKKVYPRMRKGCKRLMVLRSKQLKSQFKNSPIYGLLPASASQDNFSKKAHLYVDNWWGIAGLKATAEAAKVLKIETDLKWLTKEYEDFLICLIDNFRKVMNREHISYIPAFADYWPSRERIKDKDHRILGEAQMAWAHRPALFPGLSLGILAPLNLLKRSYQYYWEKSGKFSNFDGGWYVEYEGYFWGYNVMLAHSLVYLEMEKSALKSLRWSIKHQSCPGGWMEAMNTRVNKRGLREIDEGIVGDMPHGWTAAHYVLMLRNMLLREEKGRIILLSCVPQGWLGDGKRIEVKRAPTYFGEANFSVTSHLNRGFVKLKLDFKEIPPEGYILVSPLRKNVKAVKIDGKTWDKFEKRKIMIPPEANEILVYYKNIV